MCYGTGDGSIFTLLEFLRNRAGPVAAPAVLHSNLSRLQAAELYSSSSGERMLSKVRPNTTCTVSYLTAPE